MSLIRTADAIARAGSASKLAELLNITRQAVFQWGEHMPPLQVYRLKELKPRWFASLRRQ